MEPTIVKLNSDITAKRISDCGFCLKAANGKEIFITDEDVLMLMKEINKAK